MMMMMYVIMMAIHFSHTKLRRLFARLYVKNPLRIETFSNLLKHELGRVKETVINGETLKYVVISRHKSAWSLGFGHFFMSEEESHIWTDCISSYGVDDRVFPSSRQLGQDVRKVGSYFILL